ncbi:MAG: hypothetical protein M0Z66_07800 [Thermaerobacter sp.]|nr:hypothetical protein [Thermaerobacter sp.]
MLVRYAVPGTLLATPLVLLVFLDPNIQGLQSGGLDVLAAGALIPVGYLVHQLWFALFEARGGYVTLRRPNLAFIVQDHNVTGEASAAAVRHAYYAWEDWVYGGKVPEGHLHRARRLWQLYHGLSSSALAALLAAPQAVLLRPYLPVSKLGLLAAVLLAIGVALAVRARTILREAHEWELMMAVEDAGSDGPHRLRAGIARFLDVEVKMGRQMREWQKATRGGPASPGAKAPQSHP